MQVVKNVQKVGDEEVTILIEPLREVKKGYNYGDQRKVDIEELVDTAEDMFGSAMKLTQNCAKRAVENIKTMMNTDVCPDEFELSFSVSLDSEVGAFIAKVGGEAQLQVSMKWSKSKENKSG